MLSAAPLVLPVGARDEAKAYLRIAGEHEDVLVERLMRSAAELCERFIGQALVARSFGEVLPTGGTWTRLGATPVRAISGVEALAPDGTATPLASDAYAIDIDANADGWVRVIEAGGAKRMRVSFEAGLAADWTGLPEALRQGAVLLAAHLYAHRDAAGDAGPPAAVAALWRPFRRMRLR